MVSYEKNPILRTLSTHLDISKLPALGHFYLALTGAIKNHHFLLKMLQWSHDLPVDTHLQCGIFFNNH